MARKRKVPLSDDQPKAIENVRAELDALVISTRPLGGAPIHKIRDACCELIKEKLWTEIGELDISYDLEIESQFERKVIVDAWPKTAKDRSIADELSGILELFDRYKTTIGQALMVFNGLQAIVNGCKIHYLVDEDEFGGPLYSIFAPEHVEIAEERLKRVAVGWFRAKVREETQDLKLVDRVAEVRKRIANQRGTRSPANGFYTAALEDFDVDLKTELTIEIERIQNLKETQLGTNTGTQYDPDGTREEPDPTKRGLSRQLAMLLIDDLFPNLKNASKKSKADFLGLLTGYDAEALRQKWGDYLRGNPTSIESDRKKVAEWRRKLSISD